MSERKERGFWLAMVLAAGVLSAAFAAFLLARQWETVQFRMLGTICSRVMEEEPQAGPVVLRILKEYTKNGEGILETGPDGNVLSYYGYSPSDFFQFTWSCAGIFLGAAGLGGVLLFLGFWYQARCVQKRIWELTLCLEKVNRGQPGLLVRTKEDGFSKLEDEICKTVTMLNQTKDQALKAKENYARNLSNIAHQLKTPITAMSLSAQMMRETSSDEYAGRISKQLSRLTYLEESLLLLSRIDAGTLVLEKKWVDVFTVLTLAADNLEELSAEKNIRITIPELEEVRIEGDMEWIMEALMNLMKNCMEHTPYGGEIRCFYEKNPLYARILIQDSGPGFAREDLPHVFERFYRGKKEKQGGIGIGLSLAKELIELQNGTVRALNVPEGGGEFEIHFYCH